MEKSFTVSQYLALLSDASFVVEEIFPTTQSQVTDRFERPVPELEILVGELNASLSHIRIRSIAQIRNRVINVEYPFQKLDFSNVSLL